MLELLGYFHSRTDQLIRKQTWSHNHSRSQKSSKRFKGSRHRQDK